MSEKGVVRITDFSDSCQKKIMLELYWLFPNQAKYLCDNQICLNHSIKKIDVKNTMLSSTRSITWWLNKWDYKGELSGHR